MKLSKKIRKVLEELNWCILGDGKGTEIEIENCSPAGEDLIEQIDLTKPIKEQVWEIYNDFDEDEHVEMWVEARRNGVNGVPSIRELVQDADEIKRMYEELAIRISEVA